MKEKFTKSNLSRLCENSDLRCGFCSCCRSSPGPNSLWVALINQHFDEGPLNTSRKDVRSYTMLKMRLANTATLGETLKSE